MTPKAARAHYLRALHLAEDAVSERQWYRWMEDGLIPTVVLVSGRRRVRTVELDALIRAGGIR